MKPSVFKKLTDELQDCNHELYNLKNSSNCDWERKSEIESRIVELKTELEKCEIVNVSFSIGYRSYYEKAYKVGKYLYTCSTMTKLVKRHYAEIIPEITDKMKSNMMDDSYYY